MWPFNLRVRQKELTSIANQLEVAYNQIEAVRTISERFEKGDMTSFVGARTFVAEEFLVLQQRIQRLLARQNEILTQNKK